MKTEIQKISFDKIRNNSDGNFLNFVVFPENNRTIPDITFDKPFLLEGMFFALCIKGSATIKINTKEHKISPNSTLVLQMGQLIHITNVSPDFLIESLYVSVDFLIKLPEFKDFQCFFKNHQSPCIKVSEEVKQNLLEYYSFLIKRYNRENQRYNDTIIQGILLSLTMEYLSIYNEDVEKEKNSASKRCEEITNNFLDLVMKHCNTERNIGFYADKLCITSKYLSTTVRQTTGRSALEWIHEMFIINSKMLLKNTDKTISEICDVLNVSNDSFFCRFFKEQTGMSPLQFRNSA